MMYLITLLHVITLSFIIVHNSSAATDKVICYYESWASSFAPSDIDVNICTHVNYAFLGLNNDGSLHLDGNNDTIKNLRALKNKNPNLKLLFSVGGWSEGSKIFSSVAASSKKRTKMATSALQFIKKYNFDGIDIDWEYPGKRGGKSSDKKNFVNMLKTLHKKLKDHDYLLSVAVASSPDDGLYDAEKISDLVDFINVMTYDFHGASEGKTGENAPLYASSKDSDWEKHNANCDAAIRNWKNEDVPSEKLILGLAFYGHSYKLKSHKNHGIGAPIKGDNGQLSYSKICSLKGGWREVWDSEQKVPYIYKGTTWIGYDNPSSIGFKVQYAKYENLGGVMIWSVDQDDKNGSCGTEYALLKAIKNNL